tara:strand:- start:1182 stop:1700 length:519 start_codon:yes stop_codon:yes gene_type:complete
MGNGASTVHAIGDEIGRGTQAVTSSIVAPNYFLTVILPFTIITLLGYAIGWSSYKNSSGITYTEVDSGCKSDVTMKCYNKYKGSSDNDMNLRNRCVSDNLRNCPKTQKKTSKTTVLLIYIFVPIIIAAIISTLIYQTAFYYKNPKAAALITTTKLTRNAFKGGRSIRKRYKK